ncbi:YbiU family protein [Enterovibrio nigricans]|uniref:Uncharacterized protein n=1 Tax=Enterovibrio nigricans DSM 22720 TaxID=1121868 RepID=A0A1T4TZH5_9GAMM|nr:YbiU family protein [Enterovibrio nigricans]SKA45866.1 Protein of unknown function [Enterovibrio nigricans DSM 22720]
MALSMENLPKQVQDFKKALKTKVPDYSRRFEQIEEAMEKEVLRIQQEERLGSAIPQFAFSDIAENGFDEAQKQQVLRAGGCIIRGTLPAADVTAHNEKLSRYIVENGYYEHTPTVEDNYFSQLNSDKPQLFGIYWSQAQIWARQHPNMATTPSSPESFVDVERW